MGIPERQAGTALAPPRHRFGDLPGRAPPGTRSRMKYFAGVAAGDLAFTVGTGYGRTAVPFSQKTVTEISCHARGAGHMFGDCGTVIDIGGQDSKVIRVGPGGRVLDFAMNDKCAAETGRFLEVMAARLEMSLEDMGRLSLSAEGEMSISSVCTVFAESEIVSLVAKNHPVQEVVKGLHRSVVGRVMAMARSIGLEPPVCMTGGVALNRGVVALFRETIDGRVAVPDDPQLVGALGAALIARAEAS